VEPDVYPPYVSETQYIAKREILQKQPVQLRRSGVGRRATDQACWPGWSCAVAAGDG
jgi:hypothetical protein